MYRAARGHVIDERFDPDVLEAQRRGLAALGHERHRDAGLGEQIGGRLG
jgi:hypothetical protein